MRLVRFKPRIAISSRHFWEIHMEMMSMPLSSMDSIRRRAFRPLKQALTHMRIKRLVGMRFMNGKNKKSLESLIMHLPTTQSIKCKEGKVPQRFQRSHRIPVLVSCNLQERQKKLFVGSGISLRQGTTSRIQRKPRRRHQ